MTVEALRAVTAKSQQLVSWQSSPSFLEPRDTALHCLVFYSGLDLTHMTLVYKDYTELENSLFLVSCHHSHHKITAGHISYVLVSC